MHKDYSQTSTTGSSCFAKQTQVKQLTLKSLSTAEHTAWQACVRLSAAAGVWPKRSIQLDRTSRQEGLGWVWKRVTQGLTNMGRNGSAAPLMQIRLQRYTCTDRLTILHN